MHHQLANMPSTCHCYARERTAVVAAAAAAAAAANRALQRTPAVLDDPVVLWADYRSCIDAISQRNEKVLLSERERAVARTWPFWLP